MHVRSLPLWYRLLRGVWHGPAGQAVQRRTRIKRLANTLKRSSVVREQLRFVVRDLAGSPHIARYTLAGNGRPLCLRHGKGDIATFDELMVQGEYEVPPEVEPVLTSIGRPLRVLDLGGHIGLFGAWAAAHWDVASIVSYEPDPNSAAVLWAQSRAQGGITWEVVPAAAWNANGRLPFVVSSSWIGHVDPEGMEEPETSVAARDVLPHLMEADVVKIDIEGAEWTLLEDPRFARTGARVIVLEAHARFCPDPASPARLAQRTLERAGLRVAHVRPKPYGRVALLWAIRP